MQSCPALTFRETLGPGVFSSAESSAWGTHPVTSPVGLGQTCSPEH